MKNKSGNNPRNCDVYRTSESAVKAFYKFCGSHELCRDCEVYGDAYTVCGIKWMLMKYKKQGAGK